MNQESHTYPLGRFALRSAELSIGPEVTEDRVQDWRKFVDRARETKGLGLIVLPFLHRLAERAEASGLYAHAAQFWNEQVLIADQYRKALKRGMARFPGGHNFEEYFTEFIVRGVAHAANIMDTHAHTDGMREVIDRRGRFEGQAFLAIGEYKMAIKTFENGILTLKNSEHPENALELEGMLAEAFIRDGQVELGIETGLAAFDHYVSTQEGQELRDSIDRDRWLKWRAGAMTKTVQALMDTDSLDLLTVEQKNKVIANMRQIYSEGKELKKDDFAIRKEQLEFMWGKLRDSGFVLGSIEG